MVALSVAVLNKQGKILLARQFVEMTRMKVENHLATFPKLIDTDRQHNTVETAEVRYVYQPVETLNLVLVTTKQSNIVEDLETLRMFSKVLPEYCPGELDEAAVCKNGFELLFAFDEIIACGCGYREDVSLRDVQTVLEMESHEEKLAVMIRQSKEREAQQAMAREAKRIATDKRNAGFGSGGGGMSAMRDFADDVQSRAQSAAAAIEATSLSMGGPGSPSFPGSGYTAPPKKGKGLQLGSKSKGPMGAAGLMAAMEAEGSMLDSASSQPSPISAVGAAAGGGGGAGISLVAEEKLAVTMSRDGGLQSMEVKGELQLLVTDPSLGKAMVPCVMGANPGYQFKTHPNINKVLWSNESKLGLKDPARPFPTGTAVGVLKWRAQSADETLVPIIINCWPTQTGGDSWEINVEYELGSSYSKLEVRNLCVVIPAPVDSVPSIVPSIGQANFSKRESTVTWEVPIVDASASTGTVEFTLTGMPSSDALFPINVSFSAPTTLCQLAIPEVRSAEEGGGTLPFSASASLAVESYQIS